MDPHVFDLIVTVITGVVIVCVGLLGFVVGRYERLVRRLHDRARPPPLPDVVIADPPDEEALVQCTRCEHWVPRWFVESFPTGELICRADTMLWRYPAPGETLAEYEEARSRALADEKRA
jgi:hypothetical protein